MRCFGLGEPVRNKECLAAETLSGPHFYCRRLLHRRHGSRLRRSLGTHPPRRSALGHVGTSRCVAHFACRSWRKLCTSVCKSNESTTSLWGCCKGASRSNACDVLPPSNDFLRTAKAIKSHVMNVLIQRFCRFCVRLARFIALRQEMTGPLRKN